jgi:peptidoglycan/xylan/chitin deacetylase (PgdA/CDA1 family)
MNRVVLLPILIALFVMRLFPAERALRFVSVTFHNVVDNRADLDPDAVATDRLVAFFEFLRGNGWTAISLDDVERAARMNKPLPERAVLLTVDDGYRSSYTRVFPLLLAYRVPAVMAVVGAFETEAPQGRFISWDEAREMQRSGLVEFASHTYDLHGGMIANPQGNKLPAAAYRKYGPIAGYESEQSCRLRVREDLVKSIALMNRELGRTPRALVWPYGEYTTATVDVAPQVGFTFALTLDSEPADASKPMAIPRYLLSGNFDFGNVENDLRSKHALPAVQRLVRLDPSTLWATDAREMEVRLGRAIERVRALGATSVVIDAALSGPDGRLRATWFPNAYLPVQADVFSRVAWQMRTRAGVTVFGRLPVKAAINTLKDPELVLGLFHDFGVAAPVGGLVLEDVPQLAAIKAENPLEDGSPWEVRRRRDMVEYAALTPLDALALHCFRVVEAVAPRLSLALLIPSPTQSGPSSIADVTLIATSGKPKESDRLVDLLGKLGWSQPAFARSYGVWIEGPEPPSASDLVAVTRKFQRNGYSAISWVDDLTDDRPPVALVAGSVSASTFPVSFESYGMEKPNPGHRTVLLWPLAGNGTIQFPPSRIPLMQFHRSPPPSSPCASEATMNWSKDLQTLYTAFCFGYPFAMAWHWMAGGLLYCWIRERAEPLPGVPPPCSLTRWCPSWFPATTRSIRPRKPSRR